MRSLRQICADITTAYHKAGKPVNYAAKPYLSMFGCAEDINDPACGCEPKMDLLRLIGNLQTFNTRITPDAPRLKAELKLHAGEKLTKKEQEMLA